MENFGDGASREEELTNMLVKEEGCFALVVFLCGGRMYDILCCGVVLTISLVFFFLNDVKINEGRRYVLVLCTMYYCMYYVCIVAKK
jgi:hypothetical protein